MKLLFSLFFLARVALLGLLAGLALLVTPAYPQDAPLPLDRQDFNKAQQAVDAGKLAEAAELLEGISVKYPTSALIPAAMVREGELYLQMSQPERAVKTLEAALKLRNIPPDMKERALKLLAQARSAKAGGK